MRLLNTRTARLQGFSDLSSIPPYAILSHVWRDSEQSFQDIQNLKDEPNPRDQVSDKIRNSCIFAENEGFDWIWIDTCCIDKSSSAELSEAINSMYAWYAQAQICYVYMHDVEDTHPSRECSFEQSVWFTRGWTLQELLAPSYVVFLSKQWHTLGTKQTLAPLIEHVTGISLAILSREVELNQVSVAQRMCWAASRETTRIEDRAYSLMGIFDVHMPTIYGEGSYAFTRLQLEILKTIDDQSIFAWGPSTGPIDYDAFSTHATPVVVGRDLELQNPTPRSLLASSPSDFGDSSGIDPISLEEFGQLIGDPDMFPTEYVHTSHGMRTRLPIIQLKMSARGPLIFLAILACQDTEANPIFLLLNQPRTTSKYYLYHVGATLSIPLARPPWDEQSQTASRLPAGAGTRFSAHDFYRVGRITRDDLHALKTQHDRIQQQSLFIHSRLNPPTHSSGLRKSVSPIQRMDTGMCSYGFFFPAWLFKWGRIVAIPDDGHPVQGDDDGYILEVTPGERPHRTILFARDASDDPRSDTGLQPEGFRFTVSLDCACHPGPLQHQVGFSVDMITPTPVPSPSSEAFRASPWQSDHREGRHGRKRSLSFLLERDSAFTQMMLQTTPSPSRGAYPELPRRDSVADARHSRASSSGAHGGGISSEWPAWQCAYKLTHIPTTTQANVLLKFFSEVGKIEIALKRWEGCRRSNATYVYIVDVKLAAVGEIDGYESSGKRKASLPTYTQSVIPESGLILYEPNSPPEVPMSYDQQQHANALQLSRYIGDDGGSEAGQC